MVAHIHNPRAGEEEIGRQTQGLLASQSSGLDEYRAGERPCLRKQSRANQFFTVVVESGKSQPCCFLLFLFIIYLSIQSQGLTAKLRLAWNSQPSCLGLPKAEIHEPSVRYNLKAY